LPKNRTFDSKQWFPVNLTSIQNISRILAFKPTIFLPWRNPSLPKEKLSISFVVHSAWMRLGGVIKSLKNAFFLQSIEKWYQITMSYLYCSFLIELMQSLFTYDNISGLDNIFTLFILSPFFCRSKTILGWPKTFWTRKRPRGHDSKTKNQQWKVFCWCSYEYLNRLNNFGGRSPNLFLDSWKNEGA